MVQLSHAYMTTRKTIAFTIWTFVGKVMPLLFNMLFRFVIAFLPRNKHLLISWLQSLSSVILEPKDIKSVTAFTSSASVCHEMGSVPGTARRSNQSILKEIKRCLLLGRKVMTYLDDILKSRDITLPTKVHLVKAYGFSIGHVWMWELDYKESWPLENRCFWTVVLDKTLESPLDCKEIQPVHPEGDQSWVFIGRTDVEPETPILWPPDAKSWLVGKGPDAGKDWGQEEKGMTEDEMVGWHHGLSGYGFGWTLGVGDGQGGLMCCDSRGRKVSDMTERLNWTEWDEVPWS